MSGPSICNVNEAVLIAEIGKAEHRLVLVAPGVTKPVADALAKSWQQLGSHAVSVILDVDPEVCRLGYGTLEGLETIQVAGGRWQWLCACARSASAVKASARRAFEMQGDDGACRPWRATRLAKVCSLFIISVRFQSRVLAASAA